MIPVVASAMLLTGCDDQIMQWGKPANHADVTKAEIPLAVKEVIANYDNIKDYAQQYTPNMKIGIGMGADLYANNENGEGDLANANYQVFTPGNAMKNDAIMGNSGSLNFATVDKLLAALDGNMQLYGHNFFWHTQQNQTYLKSLIAPTLVVESDGDIANVLSGDASDFNGGSTGGWAHGAVTRKVQKLYLEPDRMGQQHSSLKTRATATHGKPSVPIHSMIIWR